MQPALPPVPRSLTFALSEPTNSPYLTFPHTGLPKTHQRRHRSALNSSKGFLSLRFYGPTNQICLVCHGCHSERHQHHGCLRGQRPHGVSPTNTMSSSWLPREARPTTSLLISSGCDREPLRHYCASLLLHSTDNERLLPQDARTLLLSHEMSREIRFLLEGTESDLFRSLYHR